MIVAYEALDQAGAFVRDQLVAEDTAQACHELERRGLVPVQVREEKESSGKGAGWGVRLRRRGGRSKAARKELPFFTEQMAILLETGTPVAPSLGAMERQMACPHWRALVGRLHQAVEEGGTLASAVQEFDEVFDPVFSSMIAAGEASGCLGSIMNRLAAIARQSQRVRKKIASAMIYPALLMSITMGVMGVLVFFVLPRFATVFEEMGVDLPGSTRGLLAVSGFMRGHLVLVVLGLGGTVGGVVWWLKRPGGRRLMSRVAIRAPIMGSLVMALTNARIFRLLGLLVESQVPLLEALELTRESTRNYLYAELLAGMYENVVNGRPMHEVMHRNELIPASLAQMVRTGEENAQIGRVMTLLADHLDDANETKISTLTSIMEPVILIVMGCVIGAVAISLVLPMFDLSRISGG